MTGPEITETDRLLGEDWTKRIAFDRDKHL
jgi:hypothetical protein